MSIRSISLFAMLGLLAGCSDNTSPEQQVRAVIDAMEKAAEERDVGDLIKHVSENYRDAEGQGRDDAARYARGYFIANQSIHLLTRIRSIEFPTQDEARLQVQVGMAGNAQGGRPVDLSADLYDFDVTLMREDGDWKVTHAKWQGTR